VHYCLQQDINRCWQRTQQLAAQLRQMLSQRVPGLTLQDKGVQLCGIVSFTLSSNPDAAAVRVWLERRQPPINVSRQRACWRESVLSAAHHRGTWVGHLCAGGGCVCGVVCCNCSHQDAASSSVAGNLALVR
jgi:hypothetical protein